jgi:hypothetical protein
MDAVREDADFQHHPISSMFVEAHLDALRAAPAHRHASAGARLADDAALYNAECFVPEFLDALEVALRGDGELLESAAQMVAFMPPALVTPTLPLIRALHTHPGNAIRRNCSTALRRLRAHNPEDREAVRVLAPGSDGVGPVGRDSPTTLHSLSCPVTLRLAP